jgi:hypothetical protein
MLELLKELHKKEYCNNEKLKFNFEAIEKLLPYKIISQENFYEAFECNVCRIGLMREIPNERLKYICSDCDNMQTLTARKAFYCFNFENIVNDIKASVKKISNECNDLKETEIEKKGFTLAFNNKLKFEMCFFLHAKDLINFKIDEEYCIAFLPISTRETNKKENLFFIDIYEFLELNINAKQIEINEMKLKYTIFKALSQIVFNISKAGKDFLKQAGRFWALSIANNKLELPRYKTKGGRELFLKEITTAVPYLSNDFAENLWIKEIKPKLENL